jgi:hypothetical protein
MLNIVVEQTEDKVDKDCKKRDKLPMFFVVNHKFEVDEQ